MRLHKFSVISDLFQLSVPDLRKQREQFIDSGETTVDLLGT